MEEYDMKEAEMKKGYQYQEPMQYGCQPHKGYEQNKHQQPMHPNKCNVIHKYHVQEVPHFCDYHTHIVHHNIQKHKYIPRYTCSEEMKCHIENHGCC